MANRIKRFAREARSGRKKDVLAFLNELRAGTLEVPLAGNPGHHAPDVSVFEVEPEEDRRRIQPHVLQDRLEQPFLAVCTGKEARSVLEDEHGLTTAGEDLQTRTLSGGEVLALARRMVEAGDIRGLVVDLHTEAELRLAPGEVRDLSEGRGVPLKHHLAGTDLDEDGLRVVPPPDVSVPESFRTRLKSFLERRPEVSNLDYFWGINPEIGNDPHLVINLCTGEAPADERRCVRELRETLGGEIPEPGFFEVVFNSDLNE